MECDEVTFSQPRGKNTPGETLPTVPKRQAFVFRPTLGKSVRALISLDSRLDLAGSGSHMAIAEAVGCFCFQSSVIPVQCGL